MRRLKEIRRCPKFESRDQGWVARDWVFDTRKSPVSNLRDASLFYAPHHHFAFLLSRSPPASLHKKRTRRWTGPLGKPSCFQTRGRWWAVGDLSCAHVYFNEDDRWNSVFFCAVSQAETERVHCPEWYQWTGESVPYHEGTGWLHQADGWKFCQMGLCVFLTFPSLLLKFALWHFSCPGRHGI